MITMIIFRRKSMTKVVPYFWKRITKKTYNFFLNGIFRLYCLNGTFRLYCLNGIFRLYCLNGIFRLYCLNGIFRLYCLKRFSRLKGVGKFSKESRIFPHHTVITRKL